MKQLEVIGGLLNAENTHAKRAISSYEPTASYNSNLKALKKCNAAQLESWATFLRFALRNEENEKLYKNLEILSDRIILKVESLFEMKCDDCNGTYQNKHGENPLLTCALWMQGSNDRQAKQVKIEKLDEEKPVDMVWLCNGCLAKNNLDLNPLSKIRKKIQTTVTTTDNAPVITTNAGKETQAGDEGASEEGEVNLEQERDKCKDRESYHRNQTRGLEVLPKIALAKIYAKTTSEETSLMGDSVKHLSMDSHVKRITRVDVSDTQDSWPEIQKVVAKAPSASTGTQDSVASW